METVAILFFTPEEKDRDIAGRAVDAIEAINGLFPRAGWSESWNFDTATGKWKVSIRRIGKDD